MAIFIPPKISSQNLSSIILEDGELVYNKDEKKFYTGDGEKTGGMPVFEDKDMSTYATKAEIAGLVAEEIDPAFAAASSQFATKEEIAALVAKEVDPAFAAASSQFATKAEIAGLIAEEIDPAFAAASGQMASKDDLFKNDYTSFEVTVIDETIPSGTASEYPNPYLTGQFIPYKYGVGSTYAQKNEKFFLCSHSQKSDCDVIVDWGDGSTTVVKDDEGITASYSSTSNYYKMTVSHTYAETGKYIVKIFGKDYFGIRNTDNKQNLISRVFEEDLSLADCVTDLTDFCNDALLLLKVNAARWINTKNVAVAYEMFGRCFNLYSVVGFYGFVPKLLRYNMMFSNCWSLAYTDLRIMPGAYAIVSIFNNCYDLGSIPGKPVAVDDLFCEYASLSPHCAAKAAFLNCYNLTVKDISKIGAILWDDINSSFDIGSNSATLPFYCDKNAPAYLANVPTSWGGSKADDTIKVDKAFLASLLSRVSQLEADMIAVSGSVSGADHD